MSERRLFGNDIYQCPRSGQPLIPKDGTLETQDGQYVYQVVDGVPGFLRYSDLEDTHGESELVSLNRLAGDKGWRGAVADVYGADSMMMRYVDTSDRASFIELLDLESHMNVLEVGIGFGQMTTAIATKVRAVHALEVRFQQSLFTGKRLAEEQIDNVQVACGGDDCRLPYPDNFFDVVILSLVFEWCASRHEDAPGELGQRELLAEVFRVLAPGGTMYLSTKNRYALRLLTGKRDEHVHRIRFGHALPRWLMMLILRMSGHGSPVGTLHSFRKLKRMLADAGFVDSKSFWAAPEVRYPKRYISTDTVAVRQAKKEAGFPLGEFRSTRLLMKWIPSALVKYVTPGLVFTTKKPAR